MRKKTEPMSFADRHEQFLKIGKKLLKGDDASKVTGAAIAKEAKVTGPLVFSHFGDRDGLREAVRKYAKDGKNPAATKAKPIKVVKTKARTKPVAKKPAPAVAKKPKAKVTKKPAPAVARKPKPVAVKLAPPPAPSNAQ